MGRLEGSELTQMRKSSRLRDLAKDTLFFLPAKAVPAVVGLLAVAIYTRLLSPKEYGQYVLVITAISILSTVFFGWLNQANLRFFEENRESTRLSVFTSTSLFSFLALLLLITLLWYASTVILERYTEGEILPLLRLGGLVLGVHAGYSFIINILRAERKALHYSLFASLDVIGRLGIAVLLIYFLALGPKGILWAHVIATGALFFWGIAWFYRRWEVSLAVFTPNMLREFASYGLPLVVLSIGELILSVSDRYIIGYFLGTDDVGVYAAGYNIASVGVSFFFMPLILAGFPILVQAYEREGEERVRYLFKNYLGVYFLILLPVVAGISALAPFIAGIVLGNGYVAARDIIPWIAIGTFFLGLSLCVNKPVQLKKVTKLLLYPIILASFLNLGINILLIPNFGIIGAAIATSISYFASFGLTLWLSRTLLDWSFPWQSFIKVIIASMGMYLVLTLVTVRKSVTIYTLLGCSILGAAVYFAILIVLKEVLLQRSLAWIKELACSARR